MAVRILSGEPNFFSTARLLMPLVGLPVVSVFMGVVFLSCISEDKSLAELVPMMANTMQIEKTTFDITRIFPLLFSGEAEGRDGDVD